MTDPVTDPAGNSYERSAIENWLKQHSTSPIVSYTFENGISFLLKTRFTDESSSGLQ